MRVSGLITISILLMFIYLYLSPASLAQLKAQGSVTPTLYCLGSCETTPEPSSQLPSAQTPTNIQEPTIQASPATDPCLNEPVQKTLHSGRKENTRSGSGIEKIINLLLQFLLQILQQLILRVPVIPLPPDPTVPLNPGVTPTPTPCAPIITQPTLSQSPSISPLPATVTPVPSPNTPTPNPIKSRPTPPVIIGNSRVNPICISSHLDEVSNQEIDQQLELMREAGIKWTRFDFVRSAVETSRGAYNWSKYDYIVNAAKAKGIEILALVAQWGVPEWESYYQEYRYPDTPSGYASFAKETASHYKGTITLFELGNEPDFDRFWADSPNATEYTQLLIEGYNAVKSVNPDAKVISGGLAGYQESYIQSMYDAGAKGHFDYFGLHPYSDPTSPDEFKSAQHSFSILSDVKNLMESNDDSKPIMATEVGWSTVSGGVSETTQAAYTQRVFKKIMKEDYQYVPIACIYDFKDDGTNPNEAEDNYGIVRNNFTKKPAFSTLQNMRQYFDTNFTPIMP